MVKYAQIKEVPVRCLRLIVVDACRLFYYKNCERTNAMRGTNLIEKMNFYLRNALSDLRAFNSHMLISWSLFAHRRILYPYLRPGTGTPRPK